MPEQTEKLLHFTEEVLRNAAAESEQMKQKLDQARAAALEQAKVEAKEAARHYYDKEAAAIRAQRGREVSRHWMEGKRKIYLRRKELAQEMFQRVRGRLEEFAASPQYPAHLEKMLAAALEQLPGAEYVVLRLRKEDMKYAQDLAGSVAPVKVECQEGTFSMGGFVLQCAKLGLRVDCTFDNRLEELTGHFAESFGLSLSDDLDEN